MNHFEIYGAMAAIVAAIASVSGLAYALYSRRQQLGLNGVGASVGNGKLLVRAEFYNPGEVTTYFYFGVIVDNKEIKRSEQRVALMPSHNIHTELDIPLERMNENQYKALGEKVEVAAIYKNRRILTKELPKLA